MKILFINTVDLGTNGISTFIINNAKYLANKNSVAIAYSNIINTDLEKDLLNSNISLFKLPSRKSKIISYYNKLFSVLKKNSFDVIHVNGNSSTMFLELMAAKHAKCNVRIGHVHNTKTNHPFLNILLYPLFNYYINLRLACSVQAGNWLFRRKKFFVIRNGIMLKKYSPNIKTRNLLRNKLGLGTNDVVLVNVGEFNFQKNQEFLIKLIAILPSRFKLLLIGDGDNLNEEREKVISDNLSSRVFFTGSVENVPDYLSASDIFVMPSRFEGFPFALVEAQASGLECFVSDRITKETNLTGHVKFLNIRNVRFWEKEISNTNYTKFNSRMNKITEVENAISVKGYSMEKNAERLSSLYVRVLDKS